MREFKRLYGEFHAGIKQSRIHQPYVLPFSHPLLADSPDGECLEGMLLNCPLDTPCPVDSKNRPGAPFHVLKTPFFLCGDNRY